MEHKTRYWEPAYIQVPINYLQRIVQEVVNTTITSIQGGIPLPDSTSTASLQTIEDNIMALSASVQALVDQVAASKSIEAASAASLAQLVTQSAALKDQLAAAVAAAGAAGMSAADSAAIVQAATDLHDSASALAAAAPVGTAPVAPADAIPPAAPAAPVV